MKSDKETKSRSFQYQAEVAQVMDIVINSLYTDKEIFIRELISNAADALEKIRHLQLTESEVESPDLPLEIRISLDEKNRTLTFTDTGIGMTDAELVSNLGSIAHSGATEFISRLADNIKKDISLIGQFGVGFYSVFMVSSKVAVRTRSYKKDAEGYEWVSEGSAGYSISKIKDHPRGTSIVLHLKDNPPDPDAGFSYDDFIRETTVERIIRKYSNFVPFPIFLNDKRINTIDAIWTRNKSGIKPEEYDEFYKFISGSFSEPLDRLHFTTDAPLALNALLFTPKENYEHLGMGRTESHVDLHCRKILIQKSAKGLLPPWLRFLYGVIDSEDIPLNISRETMQDSALIRKINKAVTRRFLKSLEELSESAPEKFKEFFTKFGLYNKEGIVSDFDHRDQLAGLLRFESSKTESGSLTSLQEYLDRAGPDQKDIYYINGPSREAIEAGPYVEIFRKKGIEVLYTFEPIDDFVFSHLRNFKEKRLLSADAEKLELPETQEVDAVSPEKSGLDQEETVVFSKWIKDTLGDKITEVKSSKRLVDSPVILLCPEGELSGSMQRLMESLSDGMKHEAKRVLEFNPAHPLILKLDRKRSEDPHLAGKVLEQIYDHAALSAGLNIDSRKMVERMYWIVDKAIE